jgi:hypothetical protein
MNLPWQTSGVPVRSTEKTRNFALSADSQPISSGAKPGRHAG